MGRLGHNPSKSGPKMTPCAHAKVTFLLVVGILAAHFFAHARAKKNRARTSKNLQIRAPCALVRAADSGDDSPLLAENPAPPVLQSTNLALFSYFATFGPKWLSWSMVNRSAGDFCTFGPEPTFVTFRGKPGVAQESSFTRSRLARRPTHGPGA